MYEMATLKHAFNAKDMNSLVYKILKGKVREWNQTRAFYPLCQFSTIFVLLGVLFVFTEFSLSALLVLYNFERQLS